MDRRESKKTKGINVIEVKLNTSNKNDKIMYIRELEIAITGFFRGTLKELKEEVASIYKNNKPLREGYQKVIAIIEDEIKK